MITTKMNCDDRQNQDTLIPINRNVYVKPIAFQYDLFLTKDIGMSEDYNQWFQIIGAAGPNDCIVVHINSPGGVLDTAVQLYGALVSSEAMVNISVEGACCSGASMILMAADNIAVDPNSYFLIHSYTGGDFGKFNNLQEGADFQKNWFPNIIKNVYKNFLTDDEIKTVLDGKDFWLKADDVITRFKKLAEIRQEELLKNNPAIAAQLLASGVSIGNVLKKKSEKPKKSTKSKESKPKAKSKPTKKLPMTKEPTKKETKPKSIEEK